MRLEMNNSFIRARQGDYTLEVNNNGRVYVMDRTDVVSIPLDDLKALLHAVEAAKTIREGLNL